MTIREFTPSTNRKETDMVATRAGLIGREAEGRPVWIHGRQYRVDLIRGTVVDRYVQHQRGAAGQIFVLVIEDKKGRIHFLSGNDLETRLL